MPEGEKIAYIPPLDRKTRDDVDYSEQKAYEDSKDSREKFQNRIAGNDFIVKTTESGTKGRLRVRSYDPKVHTMSVIDSLENGDTVTEIGNMHDPKPSYGPEDPIMMHVSYTKNGKKHTGYVSADYLVNSKGESSTNCDQISKDIKECIAKEPERVLEFVVEALRLNESCACEIVKAAIQATKVDKNMAEQIVRTAISVAPQMTSIIIECAEAIAGDIFLTEKKENSYERLSTEFKQCLLYFNKPSDQATTIDTPFEPSQIHTINFSGQLSTEDKAFLNTCTNLNFLYLSGVTDVSGINFSSLPKLSMFGVPTLKNQIKVGKNTNLPNITSIILPDGDDGKIRFVEIPKEKTYIFPDNGIWKEAE